MAVSTEIQGDQLEERYETVSSILVHQFFQPHLQCMATAVLAQHQPTLRPADALRRHDLEQDGGDAGGRGLKRDAVDASAEPDRPGDPFFAVR